MSRKNNEFIGIICDGNRRWAMNEYEVSKKADLSREQLDAAYRKATRSIRSIMDVTVRESLAITAFWGLSDRNLEVRNEENIRAIFDVLRDFFTELLENWILKDENQNVRLIHMGSPLSHLPSYAGEAASRLKELIQATERRLGTVIAFCLRYDGASELQDAIQSHRNSEQTETFKEHLLLPSMLKTPFQPVDAIIRTGVAKEELFRRGNFLQGYERYETAYIGNPVPMPEYDEKHFLIDLEKIRKSTSKIAGL